MDDFEEDLYKSIPIKELQNEDFVLDSVERIALKATGCSIILFYLNGDRKSMQVKAMWDELSDKFAGVFFYTVNASRRTDIMRAFQIVAQDQDHPLHQYRIKQYPSIIVYREGGQPGVSWPKAYYNGPLELDALENWVLNLACTAGYTETSALRDEQPEVTINGEEVVVEDPFFIEQLATNPEGEQFDPSEMKRYKSKYSDVDPGFIKIFENERIRLK